jgi:hypothetical protein
MSSPVNQRTHLTRAQSARADSTAPADSGVILIYFVGLCRFGAR